MNLNTSLELDAPAVTKDGGDDPNKNQYHEPSMEDGEDDGHGAFKFDLPSSPDMRKAKMKSALKK